MTFTHLVEFRGEVISEASSWADRAPEQPLIVLESQNPEGRLRAGRRTVHCTHGEARGPVTEGQRVNRVCNITEKRFAL